MMAAVRIFKTRWGPMGVAATARGLARVVLPGKGNRRRLRDLARRADPTGCNAAEAHADQAARQIREYLAGRRRRFSVPLDLADLTPFQRKVLRTAQQIPYGTTETYGQVAARIGRPRAARAVGQAIARNPAALVVPCHRVVAAGGRLGGFGGGTALKRRLLALEGAAQQKSPDE